MMSLFIFNHLLSIYIYRSSLILDRVFYDFYDQVRLQSVILMSRCLVNDSHD